MLEPPRGGLDGDSGDRGVLQHAGVQLPGARADGNLQHRHGGGLRDGIHRSKIHGIEEVVHQELPHIGHGRESSGGRLPQPGEVEGEEVQGGDTGKCVPVETAEGFVGGFSRREIDDDGGGRDNGGGGRDRGSGRNRRRWKGGKQGEKK